MSVLPVCFPLPFIPFQRIGACNFAVQSEGRRFGVWLLPVLLGLGLLLGLQGGERVLAQSQPQEAQLQCRLGNGPWRPCRMEVQDVGLHWVLRIGPERIEFRHSGDGAVRMQKGEGPWQPVTATWRPDTSLCWDGICARGDIPLD